MTAVLSLPRGLRHPSWYAPVLLPLLPLLAMSTEGQPISFGLRLGGAIILLAIGSVLALGLPRLLDPLGGLAHKEADLLRSVWFVSMFAVQVPLLFGEDLFVPAMVFFVASCALMAAIPFGAEFQQHTMAGLLSQPVGRGSIWGMKMAFLAGALMVHWVVFLISCMAMGHGVSEDLALLLLLALATAWATTTCWTLLTHGLLPGLVFSLTIPLGLMAGAVLVLDPLRGAAESLNVSDADWDRIVAGAFEFIVVPAYAVAGVVLGWRRWRALEALDRPGGETGGVFVTGWSGARTGQRVRRPRWWMLLIKEIRLQTVTLASCAVTLLLAASLLLTFPTSSAHDLVILSVILMAGMTLLLAASTSIAEERRLGTMDPQHLLPVPTPARWWMKFGVALVPSILVCLVAGAVVPDFFHADPTWSLGVILGIALILFSACTLTSSAATNALRALLFGILLSVIGGGLGAWMTFAGFTVADRRFQDIQESISTEPDRWMKEAEAMRSDPRGSNLEGMREEGGRLERRLSGEIAAPVLIACALALVFAYRNARRPAEAPRRVLRQSVVCLLVVAVGGGLSILSVQREVARWLRADALLNAMGALNWLDSLSPVERRLWNATGRNPMTSGRQIVVSLLVSNQVSRLPDAEPGNEPLSAPPSRISRLFQLPLRASDRGLLILHGDLSDATRAGLQTDAIRLRDAITNRPPEPIPLPFVVPREPGVRFGPAMPPGMMRRYGLTPKSPPEETPVAPAAPTSPPH